MPPTTLNSEEPFMLLYSFWRGFLFLYTNVLRRKE